MNQIPAQIPVTCTETLSLRLEPWRRIIVEYCAAHNKTTLTQQILKAIDVHFLRSWKGGKRQEAHLAKEKFKEMNLLQWKEEQLRLKSGEVCLGKDSEFCTRNTDDGTRSTTHACTPTFWNP